MSQCSGCSSGMKFAPQIGSITGRTERSYLRWHWEKKKTAVLFHQVLTSLPSSLRFSLHYTLYSPPLLISWELIASNRTHKDKWLPPQRCASVPGDHIMFALLHAQSSREKHVALLQPAFLCKFLFVSSWHCFINNLVFAPITSSWCQIVTFNH